MSQQQQPQTATFLKVMLWFAVLFLGYQMFFVQPNKGSEQTLLSREEILTKMREMNASMRDVSILQVLPQYESKVKAEAKEEGLSEEERLERLMLGWVLVADTELKSGLYRLQQGEASVGYNKINRAYMFLNGKNEDYRTAEAWAETYQVAPAEVVGLTAGVSSGRGLYVEVVDHLKELNKTKSVLGIPGYQLMDALVNLTGARPWLSYWLAAVILAVIVRAIVWPIAQRQMIFGRQMAQLTPMIKEIREKYKDKKTGQITNQQELGQETMKLYGDYGLNPASGCLPALIQMPLFLLVYQFMLLYKFEFTKGYFLWIHPPASEFLGMPLAPNLGERDYILIIIYGISMIGSSLLHPVSDPANARQQRLIGVGMGLFFAIMMFFWVVPSAFVLYWITTNVLASIQAYFVYRIDLPPLVKKTSVGGVVATEGGPNGGVGSEFFGKTGKKKGTRKK